MGGGSDNLLVVNEPGQSRGQGTRARLIAFYLPQFHPIPETRADQADMARKYGVEAFCYYQYWFAGRQLLERPFNEVLASGEPDFPFCLCWANQTWTGIWHGTPNRILVEQTYPGMEDHRRHFEALLPAFCDKRYLKVDGKPLFAIYNPMELPDTPRVLELC